jgi:ubiquinone/menaquinone biosynthesis C-methylase UbiE
MAIIVLIALSFGLGCSELKRFGYEGFDRDSWQQPELVLEELALAPGDQVADVGAGGGYFTFKLAAAVGPEGGVFAVDVDEDMTTYLKERAEDEGASNITVILGRFEDPLLPDGEIDLLFTSNTYHHIENRVEYFRNLLTDLAPDGRIAILELNDATWFPRTFGHNTDANVIIQELGEAGYVLDRQLDFIDRQSFLIFRRKSPGGTLPSRVRR